MAFRCQKCGRVIKIKTRVPFCEGDKGCKNPKLPRCKLCNALYRAEKTGAKYDDCPHGNAPGGTHVWSSPISEVV